MNCPTSEEIHFMRGKSLWVFIFLNLHSSYFIVNEELLKSLLEDMSSSMRMRRMNKGLKRWNEGKGKSVTWETKTKRDKDGVLHPFSCSETDKPCLEVSDFCAGRQGSVISIKKRDFY